MLGLVWCTALDGRQRLNTTLHWSRCRRNAPCPTESRCASLRCQSYLAAGACSSTFPATCHTRLITCSTLGEWAHVPYTRPDKLAHHGYARSGSAWCLNKAYTAPAHAPRERLEQGSGCPCRQGVGQGQMLIVSSGTLMEGCLLSCEWDCEP